VDDRTLRQNVRMAMYLAGRQDLVSADKARNELGWTMRPARETLIDTAASLIQHGITSPGRGRPARPAALRPAGSGSD
jgi:hypothetical protein